jgi:hypothetical protein
MKTLIPFLLISLFFLGCEEKKTIKSSDIKDGAITGSKLSGCGIGFKFDQQTGDTVELMYKGKSYIPVAKKNETDSLLKIIEEREDGANIVDRILTQESRKKDVDNLLKEKLCSDLEYEKHKKRDGHVFQEIGIGCNQKQLTTEVYYQHRFVVLMIALESKDNDRPEYDNKLDFENRFVNVRVPVITDSVKKKHFQLVDSVYRSLTQKRKQEILSNRKNLDKEDDMYYFSAN